MTKIKLPIPAVIANSKRWSPVANLVSKFFDLPVWKVLVQYTPYTEAQMLEHLASELELLDTEAWQRAQSDKERRSIIDQAHERHRTRGTDAGLKQAVAEAGGRVRRIVAPPHKFFLSPTQTLSERNEWLKKHPELRIYPHRAPGKKEVAHWGDFIGAFFPGRSTALIRSRLRVTLVKNGIETELECADWQVANKETEVVNIIFLPKKPGYRFFWGQRIKCFVQSDSAERMIVLNNVSIYTEQTRTLGMKAITPGLKPIDADGQMVSPPRPAAALSTFWGGFIRHIVDNHAELGFYRSIRLFDPEVQPIRTGAFSFWGYSRFEMPPHTAEVEVELLGWRNPLWGRYYGQPFVASDHTALQKLIDNVRLTKRKSDKILINTNTFKPIIAGRFLAGEVVAGGTTNK